MIYIASDKAKIYKYSIELKDKDSEPYEVEKEPSSINSLYCLHGVKSADILISTVTSKSLRLIDMTNRKQEKLTLDKEYDGEVSTVRASMDANFVFVGVPSTSSFLTFTLDHTSLQLTLQKRI